MAAEVRLAIVHDGPEYVLILWCSQHSQQIALRYVMLSLLVEEHDDGAGGVTMLLPAA